MAFLDEKIAKLQKEARMGEKKKKLFKEEEKDIEEDNLCELSQEEVNVAIKNGKLKYRGIVFEFENKECFDGLVRFPIIKDFFDDNIENESRYLCNKEKNLSICLSRINIKRRKIIDFYKILERILKKNKLYLECIEFIEDKYMDYSRNIIKLRMPTAYDYIYQYIVTIDLGKQCIILLFVCLEKDKSKWEKIIIGISELIEINGGDNQNHEAD